MSAISPSPDINYVVGRYGGPSGELKLPETLSTLPNAFFGPDFLYVVPEPAGILLMVLAGVAVGRRR
jgi:hypothetical protein